MLPDPKLPPIELGPLPTLHPFGILVATGIILGMWLSQRRARQVGLDEYIIADVAMWAVIPGFIGAHLYELFFYTPEKLLHDPLAIFKIWDGISSFGGFLGGAAGVIYFFHKRKAPFWHYADPLMYGFTAAWIFGRLGCTVAYDHPGHLTEFFLGMAYTGGAVSHGVRHNLGFYEVLWSAALFGFFFIQRHTPRVPGWYLTTFVLAYMPFRFMLDFLRADDARYLGLTAGQYAAVGIFAVMIYWTRKRAKVDEKVVPDGKVHIYPDGTPAVKPSTAKGGAKGKPAGKAKAAKKASQR